MKNKLEPSPTGIYNKQSRLQWHAVAFVGESGEPYLVAAPTRRGALAHAYKHTSERNLVVERINIRKGITA
jgi:hypothetical protein